MGKKAQRREARMAAAQERDRRAAETRALQHKQQRAAFCARYDADEAFRAEVDAEVRRRRDAQRALSLVLSLSMGLNS